MNIEYCGDFFENIKDHTERIFLFLKSRRETRISIDGVAKNFYSYSFKKKLSSKSFYPRDIDIEIYNLLVEIGKNFVLRNVIEEIKKLFLEISEVQKEQVIKDLINNFLDRYTIFFKCKVLIVRQLLYF